MTPREGRAGDQGALNRLLVAGNHFDTFPPRRPLLGFSTMNDAFPQFFRLKQLFDAKSLSDVAGATRATLANLPVSRFIHPGMKVAVGAGSRGISNYDIIV